MRHYKKIITCFISLFSMASFAGEMLGYTGRLVNTNGIPVGGAAGSADLVFKLFEENAGVYTSVCIQEVNSVPLKNGVFRVSLDFQTGSQTCTIIDVLNSAKVNGRDLYIEVTDSANASNPYPKQKLTSTPFASISETVVDGKISPIKLSGISAAGCSANQVLKANSNGTFTCVTDAGSSGTITDVTVTAPLTRNLNGSVIELAMPAAASGVSGYLSAADWATFNSKQGALPASGTSAHYLRGDQTWSTLADDVENTVLANFSPVSAAVSNTDTVVQAISKLQGQITTVSGGIPSDTDGLSEGSTNLYFTDTRAQGAVVSSVITDDVTTKSPSEDAVFEALALKQNQIVQSDAITPGRVQVSMQNGVTLIPYGTNAGETSEVQFKELVANGANYVGLKAPDSIASDIVFTLPGADGTSGQVLSTNGSGVWGWSTIGGSSLAGDSVDSSKIVDGSIVNADINASAAIDTTKLAAGSVDNTEFSYLNGVTSAIQTQLDAKEASLPTGGTTLQYFRGDKTLATLNTSVVPESGNLYFTDARAKAATVADAIANGVLDVAPSQNAVFDALALKANTTDLANYVEIADVPNCVLGTEKLSFDGTTWTCDVIDENLGDHIATQNIDLATFKLVGNGGTEGISVGATGNVGIGTSTPEGPLHVVQTSGAVQLKAFVATDANLINNSSIGLTLGKTTVANDAAYIQYSHNTVQADRFIGLGHYGSTPKMVVKNNGNVGIGITAPQRRLHLSGGGLQLTNGSTGEGVNDGFVLDYNSNDVIFSNRKATGKLLFGTNGFSNYLVVNDNGNVGVGTTSPTEKLEVSGNVKATAFIGDGSQLTGVSASNSSNTVNAVITADSDSNASGDILFNTGATTKMVVKNDGKVGVGTSSPSAKFSVSESTVGTKAAVVDMADNTASNFVIQQSTNKYFEIDTTDAAEKVVFGNTTTNPNFIFSGGKVGIGTTTPIENLHINDGSGEEGTPGIFIQDPTSNNTFGGSLYYEDRAGANALKLSVKDTDVETGYIALERATGRVGIGTVNPAASLEVAGVARITSDLQLSRDDANGPAIHANGASNPPIRVVVGGTERMRILGSTGNVGIGTSTPTEKLHVSGNVLAAAYLYTSDLRFKDNVEVIPGSLDKISKLRGVTFDWRVEEFPDRGFPDEKTMGFIAQEVEEVAPELVKTSSDGYKSVQYGNITALIVEAIKELKTKIENLLNNDQEVDRKIASLEAENKRLKEDMEEMKKAFKEMKAELKEKK